VSVVCVLMVAGLTRNMHDGGRGVYALSVPIGIALFFVWPVVVRVGSALDVALARALLGPSRTGQLSAEVEHLGEARAHAVESAESERRRIERDLHDGLQPRLVSLALELGIAKSRFERDPDYARSLLEQAHEQAKIAIQDLRRGDAAGGRRGRRRGRRRDRARWRARRAGGPGRRDRWHAHADQPAGRPHPGCGGTAMRAVIADDSVLLREGITRLLAEDDIEVVAGAGDADSLLEAIEKYTPDLAVIDVRMPPGHRDEGLRAAIEIRQRWPGVALLVLSQFVEERYAAELLATDTRAIGYLLKDRVADVTEFIDAVRRVAAGGTALDPEVVRQIFARSRRADPLTRLTDREREVLALMAEGRSNSAIAQTLFLSAGAVGKRVASIFTKLDLPPDDDQTHRRVMAVVRYLNS
jgi:DNA-binding NarL/FixJ family response regulator